MIKELENQEINSLKEENEKLKKTVNELKLELNKLKENSNSRGEIQKQGMIKKAARGSIMVRPAFGYKIENSKLVPAENFKEVEEIFEEFLTTNISLNKLAQKHNFSVNGLKKILTNFTYIGKIKFNNQIHNGNHQPIISTTLFNHVQNKLERLEIK